MLKYGLKKYLSFLLVLLLLFSIFGNLLIPAKPAKAQLALFQMQIVEYIMEIINWAQDYSSQSNQEDSMDEIEDIQDWFKDDTLDRRSERESWNEERKDMLDDLVNDILDNVQDMGDGEPAFIDDWEEHLDEQTNEYFEDFVNEDLSEAGICDTFGQETRQEISSGNEPTYTEQAECPLQDPQAMENGTSQDFWAEWQNLIRPAGNPFGSFMIASDEKIEREGLGYTAEIFKLTANQGFRGTADTPGIIQSYASQRASMMDLDYLLNSDELESYFGSVVDAFINRIFNEGMGSMQTGNYSPQGQAPKYPPAVSPQRNQLSDVLGNYDTVLNIKDKINLLLQNLNAQLTEQNSNLSLLNQINAKQIQCNVTTANSDSEIATLSAEISQTQTNIGLANQAITALNTLIPIMDQVIAADNAGDQTALSAALASFVQAKSSAVSIIQSLVASSSTDFGNLYEAVSDYNSAIISEIGRLQARRGIPQATWQMPQYLYGWIDRLNLLCQN